MRNEVLDIEAKIDADNAITKVIKELEKAIAKKDIPTLNKIEEKAARINFDIVDTDLFIQYDELFGKAYKLLMK